MRKEKKKRKDAYMIYRRPPRRVIEMLQVTRVLYYRENAKRLIGKGTERGKFAVLSRPRISSADRNVERAFILLSRSARFRADAQLPLRSRRTFNGTRNIRNIRSMRNKQRTFFRRHRLSNAKPNGRTSSVLAADGLG